MLHKAHYAKDWSYYNTVPATWSSIEVNVGIICASLPPLRAFVSRLFPTLFGTSLRQRSTPNRGTSMQMSKQVSRQMSRQRSKMSVSRHSCSEEWTNDVSHGKANSYVVSDATANDDIEFEAHGIADEHCRNINVVTSVKHEYEIHVEPVDLESMAEGPPGYARKVSDDSQLRFLR